MAAFCVCVLHFAPGDLLGHCSVIMPRSRVGLGMPGLVCDVRRRDAVLVCWVCWADLAGIIMCAWFYSCCFDQALLFDGRWQMFAS
jgi:hypothetical protein